MLLENKVAIVTGGASGIGRATAQLFAREGAKVVVADINEPGGQETIRTIQAAGGEALFVPTDLTRADQVHALVQATMDRHGQIDVLFSNAGAVRYGGTIQLSEEDWDFNINVCLKSCWRLCHDAVPHMLVGGGGVIVITGSVQGIRGYVGSAGYQAAKGGLQALTRALAADYSPTIRVNIVLPGAVVTGMWDDFDEEMRANIALQQPLRRNGRPEDCAQAALYLASDMSSFVTGTSLIVDGGFSAIVKDASSFDR